MNIIIPARKGSKGLPGKNAILINHTLSTIPSYVKDSVIITTNDGKVIDQSVGYKILLRNGKLSGDDISTKDVLLDVMEKYNIVDEEIIMMLYLTYPERTWTDIEAALNFFIDNSKFSLAPLKRCKKKFLLRIASLHHLKKNFFFTSTPL